MNEDGLGSFSVARIGLYFLLLIRHREQRNTPERSSVGR